jgi:hypothetical protein
MLCMTLMGAPSADAGEIAAGRAAVAAAGGRAVAGPWSQVMTLGQPASAVAGDAAGGKSLAAGILAGIVEPVAIRELPAGAVWISAHDSLGVELEIISPAPADSVLLCYRRAGQKAYVHAPMTAQAGGRWSGAIPEPAIGLRGVEYYLEAHAAGRVTRSPVHDYEASPRRQGVHVIDAAAGGAWALGDGGCRMVSLPAVLAEGAIAAVLGDDLGTPGEAWRCGRWNPAAQAYVEAGGEAADDFAPGRAFWLQTRERRAIDFSGGTVFASSAEGFAVPLAPGWNQIANPFAYAIALGDVRVRAADGMLTLAAAAAAGLLEAQPLNRYDGERYRIAPEELAPWAGYFVANLGADEIALILPAREAALWNLPQTPGPAPAPDWVLAIDARLGEGSPVRLTVGAAAEAAATWDPHDRLMPPPAFAQALHGRIVNPGLPERFRALRDDIRPVARAGEAWDLELACAAAGALRLAWALPAELPADYGARLIDLENELWVDCRPGGVYELAVTGPGVVRLRLVVGTTARLEEEAEIAAPAGEHLAFALTSGNPHAGETMLRLVLQRPERISLRAYDVSGRVVRTLQQGTLAAGVYQFGWDGRDERGGRVAAGVYFLRLAGSRRQAVMRNVIVR